MSWLIFKYVFLIVLNAFFTLITDFKVMPKCISKIRLLND